MLFELARLPFDTPVDVGPGPVETKARELQPSLLGPHVGQGTDCANALLAGRWLDAESLLERLRGVASDSQAAEIDEALPFVRDLAARPAMTSVARLDRVLHAARFSPRNCWVRNATLFLVRKSLLTMGCAKLAQAIDGRALPLAYSLLCSQPEGDQGRAEARAVLRDAFVAGKDVDLGGLGDAAVLNLDDAGLSPAWYPVLGAMRQLWTPPKWRPSRDDVKATLEQPIPADDSDKARLFWQCYQIWKAQREQNDTVARARTRMKQLNAELFGMLA